jgi:peptidoglycan/xylan/chitin deacetylase (PgdA/CDA1 family)
VIGVICRSEQADVVEEFFELFKTPWEFHRPGRAYDVVVATVDQSPEVNASLVVVHGCFDGSPRPALRVAVLSTAQGKLPVYGELTTFARQEQGACCRTADSAVAGYKTESAGRTVIRLGYDLFEEVRFLLGTGQPVEYAAIASLDVHIQMLREWILQAGLPLMEIPPSPAGHRFIVCLTHDIDFVGIRRHRFDHSAFGFLYRATIGALRNFTRGRLSSGQLMKSWSAAASLPFVYLGWAKDFWEPFEWYQDVEKNLPATYFFIPFKRRAGEKVPGPHASRRASAYGVDDIRDEIMSLLDSGCEAGVHGIDSWHDSERGREERTALADVTGQPSRGIRMHWLLRDGSTPTVLERAGYDYDSTFGYNETIGYRAGTGQVFRPLGAKTLLELPMHIQDGALFYPQRLDLSEPDAEHRCRELFDQSRRFGGVLTLLWHDRSHGPERFWGGFYVRLLRELKGLNPWFGTGEQVAGWFRKRREVRFERLSESDGTRVRVRCDATQVGPPLVIRTYEPGSKTAARFADIPWNGGSADQPEFQTASTSLPSSPAAYSLS